MVVRKNLKGIRLKKKMTQQNIADEIGLTRMGYSKIENCTRDPSYKISLKIKKVMEYKDDDLFDIYEKQEKIRDSITFKIR
ncbi:helix-turn-helix transcriptional regulator [Clostridium estertheticum]|uniref:helix-turn-helix transcriptional regulator n=1 Tax=Clostridium estertheticum TaxID=238834 RepID=UPI001C0AE14A|nr:helix-turn-helix transcriptional regulator [Clostridium estertheticum]MBU3174421.1 helix-turn-helix domain-containing protein [Clostridium estertheticum]